MWSSKKPNTLLDDFNNHNEKAIIHFFDWFKTQSFRMTYKQNVYKKGTELSLSLNNKF